MIPGLILVGAVTAAIAALCWVWMQSSRASQERMEEANREMVALLREQNELLRKAIEKAER